MLAPKSVTAIWEGSNGYNMAKESSQPFDIILPEGDMTVKEKHYQENQNTAQLNWQLCTHIV